MMNKTNNKIPIFNIYQAKSPFIGIVSIPHSGLIIPDAAQEYLTSNKMHLNCDVDYEVHELVNIEHLNDQGITVIKSNIHRTFVDLNRSRDLALLNWKKNSQSVPIVVKTPDEEKTEELLSTYYDPYFEMIKVMISELKQKAKNPVSFIDLHSMPGIATDYHLKQNPDQEKIRPDFCLSDRFKLTCEPNYINRIANDLSQKYKVKINSPYIGGYITEHVHTQFENVNNIQIEINRSLYMKEKEIILIDDKAQDLKKNLTKTLIDHFVFFSQS